MKFYFLYLRKRITLCFIFFFQAEDGIRDLTVTGVQTCALPISLRRSRETLDVDCPVDLYLTVGVGAANAGELVVGGRGIAFVCVEHFTGRPNPETNGLGLAPHLLPLWIAHEVAHVVRYTSATSRADLRRIVAGQYDYWESGSRATLRELLVNEGVAVAAA